MVGLLSDSLKQHIEKNVFLILIDFYYYFCLRNKIKLNKSECDLSIALIFLHYVYNFQ